jgi:uncharacterized protein YbjT (DUF2867 family)
MGVVKVLVFGASGMIGQGVVRECLLDPEIEAVVSIGRTGLEVEHPKLRSILKSDLFDYADIEDDLRGFEACFFCLGVSSSGMSESDYKRVTYELTLAAAKTLVRTSPGMTFIFVSGAGTDATEKGSSMWARIKGKTENALLELPFKAKFMMRPGIIQPLHGAKSKTRSYRILYGVLGPTLPLFRRTLPKYVTSTEIVAKAMLKLAKTGGPKTVLENGDINALVS